MGVNQSSGKAKKLLVLLKHKADFIKNDFTRYGNFQEASPLGYKLAKGLHTTHVYSAHAGFIIT